MSKALEKAASTFKKYSDGSSESIKDYLDRIYAEGYTSYVKMEGGRSWAVKDPSMSAYSVSNGVCNGDILRNSVYINYFKLISK